MEDTDGKDSRDAKVNVKHLEFIESAIERMARNSFQAKAWCVTIIAALLAFCLTRDGGSDAYWKSITVSIVVIILFCALDSYYLYLERGYRALYKSVARLNVEKETLRDYDMERPRSSRGAGKYFAVYLSPSIWAFYLVLIALHVALLFL